MFGTLLSSGAGLQQPQRSGCAAPCSVENATVISWGWRQVSSRLSPRTVPCHRSHWARSQHKHMSNNKQHAEGSPKGALAAGKLGVRALPGGPGHHLGR